jgi:hypothetical protein
MMLFACGTNTNQQQVVVSNNEVEVTDSLVDSVTEPEFDSVLY